MGLRLNGQRAYHEHVYFSHSPSSSYMHTGTIRLSPSLTPPPPTSPKDKPLLLGGRVPWISHGGETRGLGVFGRWSFRHKGVRGFGVRGFSGFGIEGFRVLGVWGLGVLGLWGFGIIGFRVLGCWV